VGAGLGVAVRGVQRPLLLPVVLLLVLLLAWGVNLQRMIRMRRRRHRLPMSRSCVTRLSCHRPRRGASVAGRL